MPSESYHTDNSQTPSGNISPSQTGTEISQHTSISPPSPSVPTGQTPLQIQDGLPLPSRYWAILSIALGLTVSVLDGAIANDYDEAFAFMERLAAERGLVRRAERPADFLHETDDMQTE